MRDLTELEEYRARAASCRRSETLEEGMRSIRARMDLTNLQRVAIEEAFQRLHIGREASDD